MFSGRFDACLRQDRTSRGEPAGGSGALPTDNSGLVATSRYTTEVRARPLACAPVLPASPAPLAGRA